MAFIMKKRYVEEDSENEFSVDEPEEFQESSDDWTPGDSGKSSRKSRRLRNSSSKKPKFADPPSSSDSEEIDSEEDDSQKKKTKGKPKARGRKAKKSNDSLTRQDSKNIEPKETNETSTSVVSCEASSTTPLVQKDFASGAFVVLKSEFDSDGDPLIWKIDGKALLQKYVPFEQNGKKLYKNTSSYSGWSFGNKDQYYAAPVTFKVQNRKEIIVEFHKDQVKTNTEPADDSE